VSWSRERRRGPGREAEEPSPRRQPAEQGPPGPQRGAGAMGRTGLETLG